MQTSDVKWARISYTKENMAYLINVLLSASQSYPFSSRVSDGTTYSLIQFSMSYFWERLFKHAKWKISSDVYKFTKKKSEAFTFLPHTPFPLEYTSYDSHKHFKCFHENKLY